MKIVLSETLSYCFGVRKTLELTSRLLADRPDRTYHMLGEIVHNEHVVEALKAEGLRIVQTLDEVPPGGVVILQSHGSARERYRELERRGLEYVDATCPMVRIIHDRIRAVEAEGRTPVVIGRLPGMSKLVFALAQTRIHAHEKILDDVALNDWHEYQIDWLAHQATFFVDGVEVFCALNPPTVPRWDLSRGSITMRRRWDPDAISIFNASRFRRGSGWSSRV